MKIFLPISNSIYSQSIEIKIITIKIFKVFIIFISFKIEIAKAVIDSPPIKCINISAFG